MPSMNKCLACQQYTTDLWTPTLLRGVWVLVPAASGAKYPRCKPCAEKLLLQKKLAKLEASKS